MQQLPTPLDGSNVIEFDFSNPALYVPVYTPLLHHTVRSIILYGSRGSAKTYFACQKKVKKCFEMPAGKFKCGLVRKMKEDIEESLFSTVCTVISDWQLDQYFHITKKPMKIVNLLNGNSFIAKGMNETSAQKGKGKAKGIDRLTDVIIDEADELTLLEYIKLSGSLRGSNQIEEILCFNPTTDEHWLIDRFFPEPDTFEREDGLHTYVESTVSTAVILHTTFMHNPFLSEDEKLFFETLEKTNPDLYLSDGLGLLKSTKSGGEALPAFDKGRHVTDQAAFQPDRRVLCCWDFNRRPHHTVSVWQFHFDQASNTFFADMVKEFCLPEHSVNQVQQEVNDWLAASGYEMNTVRLIADHSGNKQDDAGAESFIKKIERQIKRDGFKVINETKPNPSIVPSLEFLNDILAERCVLDKRSGYENAVIKIRINPACKFHKKDFEKTKTGADGKLVKMVKTETINDDGLTKKVSFQVRGHGVDNSRYMAVGVFPAEYVNNYTKRKKKRR